VSRRTRSGTAIALAEGVWRLPSLPADLLSSYALVGDDGVTLIDAGLRGTGARLRAGLRAMGAEPVDVRRIVLTHAHPDHAGGLAHLRAGSADRAEEPAPVLLHERDAVYLREGRGPRYDGRTRGGRLANRLAALPRAAALPAVEASGQFPDGAVLDVAGGLRVVHTPGHTPGHCSLLHEPSGVLLVGDALMNLRRLRYPPAMLCTDGEVARRSADALGELDFTVAAFGHGPEIRTGAREAVRAFLRGRVR